jgi:hypothetical protein
LDDVCGAFPAEGLLRADLEALVVRTQKEMREEGPMCLLDWRPEEVVLQAGRVLVIYGSDPIGEPERFFLLDLRSDNGKSFTAGELYYKLYREAAGEARRACHCWFERLELMDTLAGNSGDFPLYRMWLGN